VGSNLILKFIARAGIQAGASNLYGATPLAACQVRLSLCCGQCCRGAKLQIAQSLLHHPLTPPTPRNATGTTGRPVAGHRGPAGVGAGL
jgi:hypothetical protein